MNFDVRSLACVLVKRTLIDILKASPPAYVVNKEIAELRLTR